MLHRHFPSHPLTYDRVLSIASIYLRGETMVVSVPLGSLRRPIWVAEDRGSGYPRCSEARQRGIGARDSPVAS